MKERIKMIYSIYARRAACLLALLPGLVSGQRAQQNVIPLKNWATPLYWHPSHAEREAVRPVPQFQLSPSQVSTDALTFVAITPCRLVDTRGIVGGFNGGISPFAGPYIPAATSVTIPVQDPTEATANTTPAPCGMIPSTAEAYSVNLTVVPAAAGGINYVTLWPAGGSQPIVSTVNDTQGAIVANAAIVPAGTPYGGVSVYNAGPAPANVIIDMNGFYTAPTDLNENTALGTGALMFNSTGSLNTASGAGALSFNSTGSANTANGANALQGNSSGEDNTASGGAALELNSTGSSNTASGDQALFNNTIGSNNIAVGFRAAIDAPPGNSNSIYIGSPGFSGDSSATIRIGAPGTQTSFFAAGIRNFATGSNNTVPVVIDIFGQLGTISSSRRFKEDIRDMGDASSGLLRLRPVTFRYRQPFADGSKPIEYGLIAEEVGEVYPDLVAHSADGQVESVKYQVLDSMLLNELQKQHAEVEKQNQRAQQQDETIRQLQERLAALEALLADKR